jgi:hypothetical protein
MDQEVSGREQVDGLADVSGRRGRTPPESVAELTVIAEPVTETGQRRVVACDDDAEGDRVASRAGYLREEVEVVVRAREIRRQRGRLPMPDVDMKKCSPSAWTRAPMPRLIIRRERRVRAIGRSLATLATQ